MKYKCIKEYFLTEDNKFSKGEIYHFEKDRNGRYLFRLCSFAEIVIPQLEFIEHFKEDI